MKALHLAIGTAATAGLVALAFGAWAPAMAQKSSGVTCPEGFNFCLNKKGDRVPKRNAVKGSDGSEREEVKDGNGCTTVREKAPSGEYREVTKCS